MRKDTPFIQFFWFPLDESPQAQAGLETAITKLESLEQRFNAVRATAFDRAHEELEYHLENYFTRAHWLRERATLALLAAAGMPLAKIGDANSITEAKSRLHGQSLRAVTAFNELRRELQIDMGPRRKITHEDFFSLFVVTGIGPTSEYTGEYLEDLSEAVRGNPELQARLLDLINDMATEYAAKCRKLTDLGRALQQSLSL